jgi:putative DNA primase/helicase
VTFLDRRTGAKAKATPAKKMFGSCKGGAVWLGDYGVHMLCAEGIEKGLAIQHATGIPCAVGLSATLLPSIVWPRGTTRITLCADPNGAGEQSIHKLAKALADETSRRTSAPRTSLWRIRQAEPSPLCSRG